jgi:uncharacterized YccA/Bax inhibitor family protein
MANPTLGVFEKPQTWAELDRTAAKPRVMTIGGTILATSVLLGICAGVAILCYGQAQAGAWPMWLLWVGLFGGLGLGLVISFKPITAPFLAPVYAAFEGILVGFLSYAIPIWFNLAEEGPMLVMQAVTLTFGIMAAMLIAFAFGLIRLNSVAMKVITVAVAGVAIYYMAGMLFSIMGASWFPRLGWDSSPIGIGFSLFVVVLASISLVLDFQMIESGVKNRAPRYMEWYAGFALLVTLVWLYIEVLRLLAKLKRR